MESSRLHSNINAKTFDQLFQQLLPLNNKTTVQCLQFNIQRLRVYPPVEVSDNSPPKRGWTFHPILAWCHLKSSDTSTSCRYGCKISIKLDNRRETSTIWHKRKLVFVTVGASTSLRGTNQRLWITFCTFEMIGYLHPQQLMIISVGTDLHDPWLLIQGVPLLLLISVGWC